MDFLLINMVNYGDLIKQNLRQILKARNLRISDADKLLGQSRTMTQFLSGKTKNPSIDLLFNISKTLNIPIRDILGEENYSNIPFKLKKFETIVTSVLKELDKISERILAKYSTRNIISIILALYSYAYDLNDDNVDEAIIKLTISKYLN